jgi:Chitin binding Peritrophin-A domain
MNTRFDETCEAGQLFDINLEACQPSHIRCGSRGLPPADALPQRPEDFFPVCPKTGVSFRPHPHDCKGYFICNKGTLVQQSCAPGSHFNSRTFQCESPLSANCETLRIVVPQTPLLPDCTRGETQFFPNLVNCQQYFICVNRAPKVMYCPEGFLWNHSLLKCEESPSGLCPRH